MRTRALHIPRPLPIFILISFALALVLGAMPVDAAPKGSQITPTVVALTEIVSPGEDGAFQTNFDNTGTATFTDLSVNVTVSAGGTLANPLPTGCTRTSSTQATCPLGTIQSGASVSRLFFATASPLASGTTPLTLSATWSGDAQQNNPKASKRDTFGPVATSATVDSSADVHGGWQEALAALDATIGGSFQTTEVDSPAVANGYPALVRHVDQDIACDDGTEFAGIGLAVELRVNNGASPVDVKIIYSGAAADNTPPSQVDVIHQLDNGDCVFLVRNCLENADAEEGCYDAFTVGSGPNKQTIVEAQLPSNGRIKGG